MPALFSPDNLPQPPGSRDLTRRDLLSGAAAGSLIALGGVLRFALPVTAHQATPAAESPAPHHISLGEFDLIVLFDAAAESPAGPFVINAPEAELAAEGLTPESTVPLSVQPMLVNTGDQRVLIDTGLGPFAGGQLLAGLAAEGIAPEQIDIVLISHMHVDHFSGALDADGALAFPNARVLLNTVEYDFWSSEPGLDELIMPDDLKRQSVEPAVAALQALDGHGVIDLIAPGDEIAPGITAVDARGHTPGHLAVEITSGDQTLLHLADAVHLPEVHLAHPDWFMYADNWPAWSLTNRKALLDRAADENLLLAVAHFPFPGVGRVTRAEVGWEWTDEA